MISINDVLLVYWLSYPMFGISWILTSVCLVTSVIAVRAFYNKPTTIDTAMIWFLGFLVPYSILVGWYFGIVVIE